MKKITALSFLLFFLYTSVFASSGTIPKIVEKQPETTPITNAQKKPIKGLIILGNNYAVDADFVYVVNDTRSSWVQMPDADRVTFKVLSGQFAGDIDQIFQMGKKIPEADVASFSVISGQYGYAQDDNHIYGPHGIIPEADPDTFKMITKSYSADAGHVFFDGENITEANSGSFEVIDNGLYAVDDKHVFYAGNVLQNTSPDGFVVKGPRAFTADGRTFFEGMIEKGDLPMDDDVSQDPHSDGSIEETTEDVWKTFWEGVAPYAQYFKGKNRALWFLMMLGIVGIFSIIFVFFAHRNDESVSLWKSIIKTLIASAVSLVSIWIASLFLAPLTALIVGVIVGIFFFVTLWSALGWIKSFLITLLTLIGIVFLMALVFLVMRAVFGDMKHILEFISQPKMQLMNIMSIIGFFGGAWLIAIQLGSSLARSLGQAFVATVIALGILGLLIWITHIGTFASVILFSLLYTVLLWIMRFRIVSNLFAETVRIVRVGLIVFVVLGVVVWIVL